MAEYRLASAQALPESSDTYMMIATLHALHGDAAAAVDALQSALKLDPGNTRARDQLQKLRAALQARHAAP